MSRSKQKVLLALILAACSCGANDVGQIADQGPPVQGKITKAIINNSGNLWLVSAQGALLITHDQGQTWTDVRGESIGGKFDGVNFLESNFGTAVNGTGEVWRSTNGGENWFRISALNAPAKEWIFMSSSAVTFVDRLHGWIVETSSIWRTNDGGANWQRVLSVLDANTGSPPKASAFVGANHGWVITSNGQIYTTIDAGQTWNTTTIEKGVNLTSIFFKDQQHGWAVGFVSLPSYPRVYRTNDGGKTWHSLTSPDANVLPSSINFLNERDGWLAGQSWSAQTNESNGVVFRTNDGGLTWRRVLSPPTTAPFTQVTFTDHDRGWLVNSTSVYQTSDGQEWQLIFNGANQ